MMKYIKPQLGYSLQNCIKKENPYTKSLLEDFNLKCEYF